MLLLHEIRYFVHYYIMTLYRSASIILAISTPVVDAINGHPCMWPHYGLQSYVCPSVDCLLPVYPYVSNGKTYKVSVDKKFITSPIDYC